MLISNVFQEKKKLSADVAHLTVADMAREHRLLGLHNNLQNKVFIIDHLNNTEIFFWTQLKENTKLKEKKKKEKSPNAKLDLLTSHSLDHEQSRVKQYCPSCGALLLGLSKKIGDNYIWVPSRFSY